MNLLKQPILHFLVLGSLLYLLTESATTGWSDERQILVDRSALITFMQYRSQQFDADRFDRKLDQLSEAERQLLISDYVREEALHRAALAQGLDKTDYVIKQRLVQKMEYLAHGTEDAMVAEADLAAYYAANQSRYLIPATVTFTHVYLNPDLHEGQLQQLAGRLLNQLNSKPVHPADAVSTGDHFIYHRNYVERSEAFIAGHFGEDFANAVFEMPLAQWSGPLESVYGLHLVFVSTKTDIQQPPLEAVQARVIRDAQADALRRRTDQAIARLVEEYDVVIDL